MHGWLTQRPNAGQLGQRTVCQLKEPSKQPDSLFIALSCRPFAKAIPKIAHPPCHRSCLPDRDLFPFTLLGGSGVAMLPAPTGLQADCAVSGELEIDWSVVPSSAIATSRYFEVEIDGVYVADASYIYGSSEVADTFESPTPRHTHEVRVRERATAGGETAFSGWAETSEYCPRWVPQSVSASCNGHGVITLEWDHMAGADNYQTIGIIYTGLGGTGSQRRVHARRQEGQTYGFQVQAHTAGDWGDPSPPAAVECAGPDPGGSFWKDVQKRGILTAMGAMAATPTPATPEAES